MNWILCCQGIGGCVVEVLGTIERGDLIHRGVAILARDRTGLNARKLRSSRSPLWTVRVAPTYQFRAQSMLCMQVHSPVLPSSTKRTRTRTRTRLSHMQSSMISRLCSRIIIAGQATSAFATRRSRSCHASSQIADGYEAPHVVLAPFAYFIVADNVPATSLGNTKGGLKTRVLNSR
jgi:hypothetical protein